MISEHIIFGRLGKPDTKFVRADTGEFVCWFRESESTWVDPEGKSHRFILRFTIVPAPAESTMAVFEAVNGKWVNISERRIQWIFVEKLIDGMKVMAPSDEAKDHTETARLDLDSNSIYCPVEIPQWGEFDEQHGGSFLWNGKDRGSYKWSLLWEAFNGTLRCDDEYRDNASYQRTEYFDSQGMAGFLDDTVTGWSGVVIREDLRQ